MDGPACRILFWFGFVVVAFVAGAFSAAVAVDSERIAVAVVVIGVVAVVVVDKFSANAEVLPLHIVGAPGVQSCWWGGFALITPRR